MLTSLSAEKLHSQPPPAGSQLSEHLLGRGIAWSGPPRPVSSCRSKHPSQKETFNGCAFDKYSCQGDQGISKEAGNARGGRVDPVFDSALNFHP